MERSNVELVSTTEDPADNLEYHINLKENAALKSVLTAFRPDKAIFTERDDIFGLSENPFPGSGAGNRGFSSTMMGPGTRSRFLRNLEQRSATTGLPTFHGLITRMGPVPRIFSKGWAENLLSPEVEINSIKRVPD